MCPWITVELGKTKVYHVYHMSSGSTAHQEVVRLDITMDVALRMYDFQPAQQLIGEHQDSL
jgi:hypothetical protein